MAIPIPGEKTEAAVGKVASTGREDPTGTIRVLCHDDPRHEGDARPLAARLQPITERYRALPDSGEIADKAFFDDLSGNL
jgi:antitoxin VapB